MLQFLEKLTTKKEIEEKLEFVVSKIIMHEHEDGLENLIHEYFMSQ